MSSVERSVWTNSAFSSERLYFREISYEDATAIVGWRKNEAINQYFLSRTPITLEVHLAWYDAYRSDSSRFDYVIVRKDSCMAIGTVGINIISEADGVVEVSYMVGDIPSQQSGFGSEAVEAVMKRAADCGFQEARAVVHQDNLPSQKLVLKLGFDVYETAGMFKTYRKTLGD